MIFRKILSAATQKEIRTIRRSCATIREYRQEKLFVQFVLFVLFVFKKSERFLKRFSNDFERSDLPLSDFLFFDTQDTLFHHFRQLCNDVS